MAEPGGELSVIENASDCPSHGPGFQRVEEDAAAAIFDEVGDAVDV